MLWTAVQRASLKGLEKRHAEGGLPKMVLEFEGVVWFTKSNNFIVI